MNPKQNPKTRGRLGANTKLGNPCFRPSRAARRGRGWRKQVAEKLKTIYERAAPSGTGVEGTPFCIECRNQKHIDTNKVFSTMLSSGDGRMPVLISLIAGRPEEEGMVCLRLIDFLGLVLAKNVVTVEQSVDIYHWAAKELAEYREAAVKALEASKQDDSVDKKRARKAEKDKLYYETVFLYLCNCPQIPKHKRVRTAVDIARDMRLKLPGVKAALKTLKAEGKVVRDRSQYGDGYAAAYKQDLPDSSTS